MPNRPSVSPSGPPDLPDHPPFDETIVYGEGGWGVDWSAAPEELTAGGDGGGGGGTGDSGGDVDEVGSYRPGPLVSDIAVFSHVVRHPWTLNTLLISADTAPSNGGDDFVVEVGGSQIAQVTLPDGSNQSIFTINTAVNADQLVEVRTKQNTTPSAADVRCSFDLS